VSATHGKKSVVDRLQEVETRLKGLREKSSTHRQASETMLKNLQAKRIARSGSPTSAPKH